MRPRSQPRKAGWKAQIDHFYATLMQAIFEDTDEQSSSGNYSLLIAIVALIVIAASILIELTSFH